MPPLVTPAWLVAHPEVVVLDASYTSNLPGAPSRPARAAFEAAHIPGARFLDLDTLVDAESPLPSTVPHAALVAERLGALGIGNTTPVVLYDDEPHHTSARAWWLLTAFGASAVAILDGGLAGWRAEGHPLAAGPATPAEAARFDAALHPARVRFLDQVREAVATGGEQLVDARSPARFTGAEADPRAGVAAGHMPGAVNLHYAQLFDGAGRYRPPADLAAAFACAGVDWSRPVVTTCGSGITAAVLSFAAHLIGHETALYDGSWSEWGANPGTSKVTG